ncbi:hypothetical protein Dalk_4603 [Desulfatibacillum aliphaticivorans]|uniref:Uncharacterized protein n=2 Tax=Desulfatibacillum aliphaticivorans TaxID=218208 RepID=B8FNK0_DESAL|nr:hypothetical protein Dalk_4603 [Desulfatibacillum aliphaticivorans]
MTQVEVNICPQEAAEIFSEWSDEDQAKFFSLIGERFRAAKWGETQTNYMADCIDKSGRDFIYTLANFMKVRGIPDTSPKYNKLICSYEEQSWKPSQKSN